MTIAAACSMTVTMMTVIAATATAKTINKEGATQTDLEGTN